MLAPTPHLPDPFALGADVPQVFTVPELREDAHVDDAANRRAEREMARVTRFVHSRPRVSR